MKLFTVHFLKNLRFSFKVIFQSPHYNYCYYHQVAIDNS